MALHRCVCQDLVASFCTYSIRFQVVSLIAYVLAYFPGGTQTLRLGGSLALRGAGSLLPR